MNLKNRLSSPNIGFGNGYGSVKSFWSSKGWIQNIRSVGCRQDNYISSLIKTIHLNENLIQGLLSFVMAMAEARTPMTTDSINFINKYY